MSVLIDIDHEAGDTSEYNGGTSGADLSVTAGAALVGTSYGLSILVDDTTGDYGAALVSPNTSGVVRVRFHFDPNSITMATGATITLLAVKRQSGAATFGGVRFEKAADGYYIGAYLTDDGGSNRALTAIAISDAPHVIECKWVRASTDVAADGTVQLWVDGSTSGVISPTYDNYDRFPNFYQLLFGGFTLTGTTPSGTFYLDQLVVNDDGGTIGGYHAPVSVGGTLTPAGTVAKRPAKALAGVLSWIGGLGTSFIGGGGGGTEYTQAAGGTLTTAGAISRRAAKSVAGTLSTAGSLVKRTAKALAGVLVPEGMSGDWMRDVLLPVGGTLTTAGSTVKRTAKAPAGTVTPAGGMAKRISKGLAGVLSWAGGLATSFVGGGTLFMQAAGGTLSTAGAVTRRTAKNLAGAIAPAGAAVKLISKTLAGALGLVGGVAKRTSKMLAGALNWAGALVTAILSISTPAARILSARLDHRYGSKAGESREGLVNPDKRERQS